MEKKNKDNIRFYILLVVLIILSVIITYFNYRVKNTIVIPRLDNSTYKIIKNHIKLLKNVKKLT
jgi:hypothetical protein